MFTTCNITSWGRHPKSLKQFSGLSEFGALTNLLFVSIVSCGLRLSIFMNSPQNRFYNFLLQIAVLVSGSQNNVVHYKTLHTRLNYFSKECRVVNFDNLVPYDELSTDRNLYLLGKDCDKVRIHVIITPMAHRLAQDEPSFDLK